MANEWVAGSQREPVKKGGSYESLDMAVEAIED
jgi:hypothetical protein